MATQNDLYQSITDRIIAALETGAAPWVKPWKDGASGAGSLPCNAVSGRPYHGVNTLLLMMQQYAAGYPSARWLTFKQAESLGGHVKKGEKATQIAFWKFYAKTSKDGGADDGASDENGRSTSRGVPMLKLYYVFNVAQCEDLNLGAPAVDMFGDDEDQAQPAALPLDDQIALIGADIRHGGDRAYYTSGLDFIGMPEPKAFQSTDLYYSTLLHEITHWTSHKDRCARELGKRFGDESYAAEELIAEMGSAFLCAHLGVELHGLTHHAAYLQSWIRVLKADNRAIFTAAKQAQCAADYVMAKITGTDAAPADDEAIAA